MTTRARWTTGAALAALLVACTAQRTADGDRAADSAGGAGAAGGAGPGSDSGTRLRPSARPADGRPGIPARPEPLTPVSPAADTGRAPLERLEREARAIARATGCERAGDCRAAPVGDRPCGGPRTFIVYCARTTDSAALARKLDELARAEREYNRRNQLASTCELRLPPEVALSGGACTAAAGRP